VTGDPRTDLRSLGARSQGAHDPRVRPIASGLFADRPAANMIRPGSFYYATDTQSLHYSDGSNWSSPVSEWQDYTPVWTVHSGTAPAIGNGSISGRFMTIGRLCVVQFDLTAGSTTTFGSGGFWRFSLPASAAATGRIAYALPGSAELVDAGVQAYLGMVKLVSTTTWEVVCFNASGTYLATSATLNTVPFSWGSADWVNAMFAYEI